MSRLLIAFLAVIACTSAHADIIRIPVGQQGQTGQPLPNRGDTTDAVLDRFGLADEEHPAVGNPPIRRWDYRYFSVYFEQGRVIDSVRHHQRTPPPERVNQP